MYTIKVEYKLKRPDGLAKERVTENLGSFETIASAEKCLKVLQEHYEFWLRMKLVRHSQSSKEALQEKASTKTWYVKNYPEISFICDGIEYVTYYTDILSKLVSARIIELKLKPPLKAYYPKSTRALPKDW